MLALPTASLVLAAAAAPAARPDGDPLPVDVVAVASTVSDEGTFTLRLGCTPRADFSRRHDLRVALTPGSEDLVVGLHELDPPTSKWRAGSRVDYTIALALPEEADLHPDEFVGVRIGFVPAGKSAALPLDGEWADYVDEDGLTEVLAVRVPEFALAGGRTRLDGAIAEARELRSAGDAAGAWARLDEAVRAAADDTTKARLRAELETVGRMPPPPPTSLEEEIVAQRIRGEKVRVYRLHAGRMYDRGELHGALRLLEEAGGALAVSADQEVIGALADADRVTKRVEDIEERLLTELTDEEQARVDALVAEHGRTEELFEEAQELAAEARYPLALALLRKLRRVDGIELYDRAQARLEELGAEYVAATPPAQAEKVRAVLEHPAWARTTAVPSHAFLFIGPEELVEGIADSSKRRFDLAYVFVTDLFGRRPNPGGDRITVYFKELWDFGGGVGGGKIINIGRADPSPKKAVRVDNGLLYHELTHCVDDTTPIHAGFREGLANLGAAYAHEALDQKGDALHSFQANLASFRRFFLDRDLEYWRIQNYGPSAGFFLHFVDTYAGLPRGQHDWSPLRRFFREYRDAPVRDGREPTVARALGHYLVRAFGPRAFDDLVGFGFPLVEADRELLAREQIAFEEDPDLDEFLDRYAEHPNSPLPRDALERLLSRAAGREDLERAAELRAELGIVSDWKVIGPFFAKRADPGAHPFPPELEIDFAQKPLTWRSSRADRTQRVWQDPIPDWRPTGAHKNVVFFPSGWLRFDYEPYGDDNSAIYALTHVTVPTAVDAVAHLRADDDVVLFVNDRRIVDYRGRGTNGSTHVQWRGPWEHAPDAMRAPVRLAAGRNRVLVKLRNRAGTAGLILAFAQPDGAGLTFEADAGPPDEPGPRAPVEEPSWRRLVSLDHRSFKSKSRTAVGGFRASKKAFSGTDTAGRVAWRLFTVRPGFPKDSPSNLLWLKPNLTEDLDSVRIDVGLASGTAPKLLVTFQGEGGDDGLSGWNLILVPDGAAAVRARLERYDRLVYHTDPVELPAAEDGRIVSLRYWDGWCTVEIDGVALFDRLSIHPIPGRHRIGLATWGPEPKLRSVEVSRGR